MALARQWMKFIVVTQGFKAVGLPQQLPKPKEQEPVEPDQTPGLDCGAALQSDTSADGAEFEFDAGNSVKTLHPFTDTNNRFKVPLVCILKVSNLVLKVFYNTFTYKKKTFVFQTKFVRSVDIYDVKSLFHPSSK